MSSDGVQAYSTLADRKMRYGGVLENPWISMIQRGLTDIGRVRRLKTALWPYAYESVLDVGCGLGEGAAVRKKLYVGLDNSFGRVCFAARHHPRGCFVTADGRSIPAHDASVDLTLLLDTSHHLTDEEFRSALRELKRVSRRYIVVGDPILTPGQGRLSAQFYRWDRGSCFRTIEQTRAVFASVGGLRIAETILYTSFPGIYSRAISILEKEQH